MSESPPDDRASRARADTLTQLLETHDEPAVLIDADYSIVAMNGAYAAAYGRAGDDLRGMKCHRISHHSEVPCHERGEDCPVKRVMRDGRPVETLHIHFHDDETPERVQVKGFPVDVGGRRLLLERVRRLEPDEPLQSDDGEELLGSSPAMLAALQRLIQAAGLSGSVLIQGESGVGKELAARFVHRRSSRSGGPFVTADCTAIPETLFESELFGHERGAFTGSAQRRIGLFESASDGTLFLDEIGELPMTMQAKLLRAIESGEIRRLGSTQTLRTRVRIVAATNRDLRAMVAAGQFRLDLYYRLATHEVTLPPLRDRTQDIAPICRHLLTRFGLNPPPVVTAGALARLARYTWPGNVRELRNVLERTLAHGPLIDEAAVDRQLSEPHAQVIGSPLLPTMTPPPATGMTIVDSAWPMADARQGRPPDPDGLPGAAHAESAALDDVRHRLLIEQLERHRGNRARVAESLGVSERTVYRWIRRYKVVDGGGNP
ncbi:MAG: sigma-54 dependent transcriptional regulator [Burkholderiaceae bacterium]